MTTIREAKDNLGLFVGGFEAFINSVIENNKSEVVDYVVEQLYSGVNGNGKPLRPTYLNDPWFNKKESGRWYKDGSGYANWKRKKTPPTPSYLGIPGRDYITPNLIIRGDFYASITAIPIGDGLRIYSNGVAFGNDIEHKYGSAIFGIGPDARRYFIRYVLNPELKSYFSKFNL